MVGIVGRAVEGIYQVMRGLKTVAQHTLRPPTTKEYPDIMPELPGEFRGRLALTVNPETGEHLCISCRQCERVCPDKCIEITAHKSPETGKLELIDFRIDHGLCMFCGLCTEVCPTTCIINTNDFEMADYTREALIYDLKKLTLTQEESAFYFSKKELPLPKPKPAKAQPKPAPAAAAKPAEGQAAKPVPAEGEAAKPEGKLKPGEGKAEPQGPGEERKAEQPGAQEQNKAGDKASCQPPDQSAAKGEAEAKPAYPESSAGTGKAGPPEPPAGTG